MPDWLELELAHQLSPAAAPDALWERIQSGRPPRRHVASRWPVAAILTLAAAAATFWLAAKGQEPVLNLEQMALQQLQNPAPLDLASTDPARVAAWMRQHSGVALSIRAAAPVRLAGARLVQKRGTRITAVDYRVGNDTATLLIACTGPASDSPHGGMSWKSGGVTYALACSNRNHQEAACLLCHAAL